jgi:hypothetical protein
MKKKGLSAVIATVILIGLTVAMAAVIGVIVNNFAKEKLNEAERCYGILDKIKFNGEYTCYNSVSNQMQISISRGDVELEEILMVIELNENSNEVFNLTNITSEKVRVKNYPSLSEGVKIPAKESGKTYVITNITTLPSKISLVPIIDGKNCDTSDYIYNVGVCSPY